MSNMPAAAVTASILLAADGDERLSGAYDDLYAVARTTVGKAAHDAWNQPVITDDTNMNMGDVYRTLMEFTARRHEFADELRTATLPRRLRIYRWVRANWRWTRRIPGARTPHEAIDRQITAPQNVEDDPLQIGN